MRIAPALSVLLVAALAQPVLAATGEREAQAHPGAAPAAGGGTAHGPNLPNDSTQPPPRPVPRSGPSSSPSRPSQEATGASAAGGSAVQGGEKSANQYAPDNTGRNRDHDRRPEAEDQSNNAADVEAVARIRRALTDDASLSLHAHNVKIIIEGGRVTLRGPVKGEAEKRKVESIVRRAAGGRQVVNQLEATGR